MKQTHLSEVLRLSSATKPLSSEKRKELGEHVRSALYELSFGLSGAAANAFNSACAVEGGDMDWKEAGTLEEMQTVVLLADRLNFLLYTDSEVRLQDGIGEVLKRKG